MFFSTNSNGFTVVRLTCYYLIRLLSQLLLIMDSARKEYELIRFELVELLRTSKPFRQNQAEVSYIFIPDQ